MFWCSTIWWICEGTIGFSIEGILIGNSVTNQSQGDKIHWGVKCTLKTIPLQSLLHLISTIQYKFVSREVVVFVVHIVLCMQILYFYKGIQYNISVPILILGTDFNKSVPRIRPWNRNNFKFCQFEFHREETVLLMGQILKFCSKTSSVDTSLSILIFLIIFITPSFSPIFYKVFIRLHICVIHYTHYFYKPK